MHPGNSEEEVPPIYRIPVDVLFLIAGQLGDIKDLNAFSESCKGFHNHIAPYRANSSLWCNEVVHRASSGLRQTSGRLHGAIKASNNQLFILLVWRGADLNERNDDGYTVLHLLASGAFRNLPTITSTLIRYGADPNAIDAEGKTPLHRACFWSPDGAVDALLAHPDTKRNEKCTILGWTPLHYAVYNWSAQAVHALLSDPTVNLGVSDVTGGTALHIMYQINPPAGPEMGEEMDPLDLTPYQYSLPQNRANPKMRKAMEEAMDMAPGVAVNNTDLLGLTPYQYSLPQNRALHWNVFGDAITNIVRKSCPIHRGLAKRSLFSSVNMLSNAVGGGAMSWEGGVCDTA